MHISALLRRLKTEYGVNQAKLAKQMNVNPQILTDLKAGRRRLNRNMAESILALFANEPGAGWLAGELDDILAESANSENVKNNTADNVLTRLPVLDALCTGDPLAAHGYSGQTAVIPEALAAFTDNESAAYVFVIDCDDYSGRLRAGDQILIVQNIDFQKEIMVVHSMGRLRLARKDGGENDSGSDPFERKETQAWWRALDSGTPLEAVAFAGAAVGIVAARL